MCCALEVETSAYMSYFTCKLVVAYPEFKLNLDELKPKPNIFNPKEKGLNPLCPPFMNCIKLFGGVCYFGLTFGLWL